MTIKSRLILNSAITAALIVAISLTCYSSLRFLQGAFSDLAQKSTPYQTRTAELQRSLERSGGKLGNVNHAHDRQEYDTAQQAAQQALASVSAAQTALQRLDTLSKIDVAETMQRMAAELYDVVGERITHDEASSQGAARITRHLQETERSLMELESGSTTLQKTRAAAFATALEQTGRYTIRLRTAEDLRNHLKELRAALLLADTASNQHLLLIAKGKINMLLGRIAQNSQQQIIQEDLVTFPEDTRDYLRLRSESLAGNNKNSTATALQYVRELDEILNRMILQMSQEVEFSAAYLAIETKRQGEIFKQSTLANQSMLLNGELVSQGLKVAAISHRLFNVKSETELQKLASDLRSSFAVIDATVAKLAVSLDALHALPQIKALSSARLALANVRSQLFAGDGVVATLDKKLKADLRADGTAIRLNELVAAQVTAGSRNVSQAQSAQESSIGAVNGMITKTLSLVSLIGTVSILLAMLFGVWIYRSILRPLQVMRSAVVNQQRLVDEKGALAEAVAAGDLDRVVVVGTPLSREELSIGDDETGQVLTALVGMSQAQCMFDRAFADMTVSLRNNRDAELRRDRIKSGLNELNIILREEHYQADMAGMTLSFIMEYLKAGVGIMYQYEDREELLCPIAHYAVNHPLDPASGFRLGEGLPGEVARERKMIVLKELGDDYLTISSGIGSANPLTVTVMPIMYNEQLYGVLEYGSFKPLTEDDQQFLQQALEGVAIALGNNQARRQVAQLLEQTLGQEEELRVQQEELQQSNEELLERAHMLEAERGWE